MMVFAPILSLVLMVLGSGFFMSFVSLYFHDQHLEEFDIGLAHSAFYLGLLVSSLRSEHLISRVGHIRALTATCGVLSAATLVLFVVPESQWFWLRFIAGACVGCFYVGIESWLLTEFPESKRGKALAIYTIALYTAQASSQLLLPFSDKIPATAFAISAIFISLAVVPVAIGKSSGPAIGVADPDSILKFLRRSPLGVIGCFIAGMLLSTLYSYMPLFLEARGHSPGYLMTVMIAGGALLQWPIGKISDSFDRRKVLIVLSIFGVLATLALRSVDSLTFFIPTLFCLGGLFFTIYPVSMALGCDCVDSKKLVKMTGVLLFAYGCGAVLGPMLTPAAEFLGESYLVYALMIYGSILAATGIYALIIKDKIKLEEQSDFSVVPTGPVVEELHPSTAEEALTDVSDIDRSKDEIMEKEE